MNKQEALKRIKEIQNGGGAPLGAFPNEVAGNMFRRIRDTFDANYIFVQYGFEYGEIYGLMKAFGIEVDEIVNYEENLQKRNKRFEWGKNNNWDSVNWSEVKCSKCKAEGHYTFTSIGDYSYPPTFTCYECGKFNVPHLNFYYIPDRLKKHYEELIEVS